MMQTLKKPLDILDTFLGTKNGELGISDIVSLTGLKISTVQRIVSLFLKEGYLSQRKKRGKYFLGPKMFQFCTFIHRTMKIENIGHQFLEKLTNLTGESSFISILQNNVTVSVDIVHSNLKHTLQLSGNQGAKKELYCTSAGKIFLADMSAKDLAKYLKKQTLTTCTNNTITDPGKLKKQLLQIKREGVAFNYEEEEIGIRTISSPIRNSDGSVVAAIGVAGPSPRLTDERMKTWAPIVKDIALDISSILGYKG
jgi:IclR family KDG regulon transcriptional repressor